MNRLLLLAVVGVAIIIAAIGLNYEPWRLNIPRPDLPAAKKSSDNGKLADELKISPPTFDVVRINPDGNAVIAGRAMPNSVVINLDNDIEFGRVNADDRGEWVFVPNKPLGPGTHTLKLKMLFDSNPPMMSLEDVVVIVPESGKDIAGRRGDGHILALKMNPDGSSTVLQKPHDGSKIELSIDTVDYYDDGRLIISGSSDKNALIQVYIDNDLIGYTRAGEIEKGGGSNWTMKPDRPIEPGLYILRADQIRADGKVIQRIEFPFSRAQTSAGIKDKNLVIVQPGNSLWRLARSNYGKGNRYTIIFKANQDQITDPDLIYPGQVFKLPVK